MDLQSSVNFSFTLQDEVTALRRQKEVLFCGSAQAVRPLQPEHAQELSKMVKALQIQLAAEQHRFVHEHQRVSRRWWVLLARAQKPWRTWPWRRS